MSNKRYKFVLDRKGVGELLKSDWALSVVEAKANEVQGRVGTGYEVTTYKGGKSRVNASVEAKTIKARQENAKDNTLIKALY